MEALIPKLFIITAEASIVLFLILIIMIIFNIKAKRKDLKAVNELISDYTGSKEGRISSLKKKLQSIGFKGNTDEQAEKLFQNEKTVIKQFVTLYLHRDTYRLLDYPDNLIESNDSFLQTSGSGQAATVTQAPEIASTETEDDRSEETANATILAREQAESNEVHLKELSELRLKNTELNEHLFEALETITALMTEHGKKTGQEVESNAQKVLEAIIYLRDKRLVHNNDPSKLAPTADDSHDQVDSFDLEMTDDLADASKLSEGSISVDLAQNDGTLDDNTAVNLGINDKLNMDLDTLDEDETLAEEVTPEDDPWADALAEQATTETDTQAAEPESTEDDDPWADALAEQATVEAESDTQAEVAEDAAESEEEGDPWADALAEQATAEAEDSSQAEEVDPWAEALAEQEKSEKK